MRKNRVKVLDVWRFQSWCLFLALGIFSAVRAEQKVRERTYANSQMDFSSVKYNEGVINGVSDYLPSQFWPAVEVGF